MQRTALAGCLWITAALAGLTSCGKHAAPPPTPLDPGDLPANIDRIAGDVLAATGVPSASVAAVSDGKIIYVHAYGKARLAPPTAAAPGMRYSIGSISKQLTAAAVLLLAQDGSSRSTIRSASTSRT
jgi:D-alanyl-D-alanine carboxypeptidase